MRNSILIKGLIFALFVFILLLSACSGEETSSEQDVENENITGGEGDKKEEDDMPEDIPFAGITVADLMVDKENLQQMESDSEWSNLFVDERSVEFRFNKETGKLFSIDAPFPEYALQYPVLTLEEMGQKAEEILAHFADPSQYARSHSEGPNIVHWVSFTRMINGIRAGDSMSVQFCNSGIITRVWLLGLGDFDNVVVPLIDIAEFDAIFEVALGEQFPGVSMSDVRIENRTLGMRDGNLYLDYGFLYKIGRYTDGEPAYSDGRGIHILVGPVVYS